MTEPNNNQDNAIKMLTLVEPHDCSYLDNRKANSIFLDSNTPPNWQQYCQLSHMGFRRSGTHYYRPQCPACDECKSCRVITNQIDLSGKRFKRILNKAKSFTINICPAHFSTEHYDLYQKYICTRHADGEMYPPTTDQFKSFLVGEAQYNKFLEIRDQDNNLISCTAIDFLNDGISAIYTYFNPEFDKYSPGTLAVLHLCNIAKNNNLTYIYLGYWVKDSPKMSYKTQFKPIEIFIEDEWRVLEQGY